MKTTEYFDFRRSRPDRRSIPDSWIQSVVESPTMREVQRDGRIRLWRQIEEAGGRTLRVVVLADGETVHNAFFDRDFRG